MRRSTIGLALGTALLCATPLVAAATARAATVQRTHLSVTRPVTATGHAAPGFQLATVQGAGPVDCSFPDSSPAAVDKNILFCGPSANYAIACWRSATPKHVMCLMNARSHRLIRFVAQGKIATSTPRYVPAPLDITLGDGTFCDLRDGGAGVTLKQHPTWNATYYCTGGQAVWATQGSTTFGVDRSHAAWTVQVASSSGNTKVHTEKVAHAWLVGTHA